MEEKIEGENRTLRIDDWTVFRSGAENVNLALHLRQKWSAVFLRRLNSPSKPMSQVIKLILNYAILRNELKTT